MIDQVGKYKVIKELSRGGMGVVFLGMHPSLNRKVAIKMLTSELVSNKEFIQRFEREAKIIATLDHPNIVQVYDYEEAVGTFFIIMEFIDGKMLTDVMKKGKPMPQDQVSAIISQIAGALSYAHNKGIIHRDIKPGNAMMRDDGVVKLMDFGIAFSETSDVHLTQEGKVIGTPKYMSPEQLQGKKLDQRSDIYSLGVMCYEMLAGRPPFEGKDFITIASKHLKEEPESIKKLVPDISHELEVFIERSLVKDREKRLSTLSNLSLTGDKDEKTIYHEALQKRGVSKKFFYITLIIFVLIAALIVGGVQIKQRMMAEKGFQEQIESIADKKVKDLVEQAKRYFDKQDYKNALIFLEKAVIIDPDNKVVKKGIEEAQKRLSDATKKKISELEIKAQAYFDSHNYFDAVTLWKEILILDKKREDIQKKIQTAQAILDEENNRIQAREHLKRGDELETSGDFKGAEKEYLEAYRLNQKSEQAPYSLGMMYSVQYETAENKEELGELIKKAIRYLEEALAIAPEHEGILYNLSLMYLTDNKKDKALKMAERLKNIDEETGKNLIETINNF